MKFRIQKCQSVRKWGWVNFPVDGSRAREQELSRADTLQGPAIFFMFFLFSLGSRHVLSMFFMFFIFVLLTNIYAKIMGGGQELSGRTRFFYALLTLRILWQFSFRFWTNQMEFYLVQNRKENYHHNHIPFNLKGNGNIVFSVRYKLSDVSYRSWRSKKGRRRIMATVKCWIFKS